MTNLAMQVRPIRSEADHERAVVRIGELMQAKPGSVEGDELDLLATLVDAYETKHHPVEAPDPITAIHFRMEQLGMTRRDMEPLLGSRARVSEVLNGKRRLTLEMIRRINAGLGISADVLIGSESTAPRSRNRGAARVASGGANGTRKTAPRQPVRKAVKG